MGGFENGYSSRSTWFFCGALGDLSGNFIFQWQPNGFQIAKKLLYLYIYNFDCLFDECFLMSISMNMRLVFLKVGGG
jgi:hypothetical protein